MKILPCLLLMALILISSSFCNADLLKSISDNPSRGRVLSITILHFIEYLKVNIDQPTFSKKRDVSAYELVAAKEKIFLIKKDNISNETFFSGTLPYGPDLLVKIQGMAKQRHEVFEYVSFVVDCNEPTPWCSPEEQLFVLIRPYSSILDVILMDKLVTVHFERNYGKEGGERISYYDSSIEHPLVEFVTARDEKTANELNRELGWWGDFVFSIYSTFLFMK